MKTGMNEIFRKVAHAISNADEELLRLEKEFRSLCERRKSAAG